MSKKALVLLAEGFEEIEALSPVDILRRAGVSVTTAGIGGTMVKGSHNMIVQADMDFERYNDTPDVLIIPGGSKGAENLAASSRVKMLIRTMDSGKKLIAAICASPAIVLGPMGILNGRKATCYPGMEEVFPPEVMFVNGSVVQDGHIITSRGVATALDFSIKILESLIGKDTADMIARNVLIRG
jgi:4-methyl-5(b-hydroxyethyl)-thiazole monophosphate biosynthesis